MKKRNNHSLFLLLGLSLVFLPGISYADDNIAISVGLTHTLAIKDNGTLWAWGENDSGQIGDGTLAKEGEFRFVPTPVGNDSDWITVAAGSHHSLAIKQDGSLWTWGSNYSGQLGNEETLPGSIATISPVQMGADKDWLSVSADGHTSIALKKDHTLWAWGSNSRGQLGDGSKTNTSIPTKIGIDTDWAMIASGYTHTIALKSNGTLWAWGDNQTGQLGDGTTSESLIPKLIGLEKDWLRIVAAYGFSAAVKSAGTLWTWGANDYGQIGDGTGDYDDYKNLPTQVAGSDWLKIAADGAHTAAIKIDGTIWAWGRNDHGQLGDGTTTDKKLPVKVGDSNDWYMISADGSSTAAVDNNGTLSSWGTNYYGKLGNGKIYETYEPEQMNDDTDWTALEINYDHSIALKTDNTLWLWGREVAGVTPAAVPVQFGSATDWKSFSTGVAHYVAIKDDDTLWAWGDNYRGQIGDGSTDAAPQAIQIGTATWKTVSSGYQHNIAIDSDGTLWAWGYNNKGQLGNDTLVDSNEPILISADTDWDIVVAGENTSFALKTNGQLWAWGNNNVGQLGVDATTTEIKLPTQVSVSGVNWETVAAGYVHTLALSTTGALYVWGSNIGGKLGLGEDTSARISPVRLGTDSDWQSIAANHYQSLAVKADALWVWGQNEYGELGIGGPITDNGIFEEKHVPFHVGSDTDWKTVSAGERFSAAIKQDNSIWSWAGNYDGQVGNGSAWSVTPDLILTDARVIRPDNCSFFVIPAANGNLSVICL